MITCMEGTFFKANSFYSLEANFGDYRQSEVGLHRVVHQRMSFNKIDCYVRQCSRVVNASARPRLRYLFRQYAQPVAVYGLLFLESALKYLEYAAHGERAHGRAPYRINGGRKNSVNQLFVLASVHALGNVAR